jgi:hypothetical protein
VEKLASKVQAALDEARILVLGVQVLVGFGFRAFFDAGFERLPPWARGVKLAALVLELVALGLVVAPGSFHRLAEGGEDTHALLRVTTRALGVALVPFALGLGADVAIGALPAVGARGALAVGGAVVLAAAVAWFGATLVAAAPRRPTEESEMNPSSLDKKIQHVLTEARMALPGAQALIGFQLAVTMHDAFRELPRAAQEVHVAAILLTTASVILLMTPAAYHRIVERGELTERFHRVATALVVAAIAPLACALAAELGVVVLRVSRSAALARAVGGAALVLLAGAWYGFPLVARALRRSGARAGAHA